MKRHDKRGLDQLRPIDITRGYIKNADGSCLIEMGETRVVCTASLDKNVPPFLRNSGTGWVTAEYGMLPGSAKGRMNRERDRVSGRTHEIQRLIGRALRSVVDLKHLGERSIIVDCDVIQADGGTRTASVVGGYIALSETLRGLLHKGEIKSLCLFDFLGAVSVGMRKGDFLLDLCYEEDSSADVDLNVVMRGSGEFIEVQGTGEHASFSQDELNQLLSLAKKGISEILELEKKLLKDIIHLIK